LECYNLERRRSAAGSLAARGTIEDELAAIERRIGRAVAAIIDDRITREEAEAHLPALRARRAELAARLVTIAKPPAIVTLQPAEVDTYLGDRGRLEAVVNRDLEEGDDGAAKAIRALVDSVTITPPPGWPLCRASSCADGSILLGLDPFQDGSPWGEGGAG
jgi:hypothetical protein